MGYSIRTISEQTWNKTRILEAFANPDSEVDQGVQLNKLLDTFDKSEFNADDVFAIVCKFVPANCVGKLTNAILRQLTSNR